MCGGRCVGCTVVWQAYKISTVVDTRRKLTDTPSVWQAYKISTVVDSPSECGGEYVWQAYKISTVVDGETFLYAVIVWQAYKISTVVDTASDKTLPFVSGRHIKFLLL